MHPPKPMGAHGCPWVPPPRGEPLARGAPPPGRVSGAVATPPPSVLAVLRRGAGGRPLGGAFSCCRSAPRLCAPLASFPGGAEESGAVRGWGTRTLPGGPGAEPRCGGVPRAVVERRLLGPACWGLRGGKGGAGGRRPRARGLTGLGVRRARGGREPGTALIPGRLCPPSLPTTDDGFGSRPPVLAWQRHVVGVQQEEETQSDPHGWGPAGGQAGQGRCRPGRAPGCPCPPALQRAAFTPALCWLDSPFREVVGPFLSTEPALKVPL